MPFPPYSEEEDGVNEGEKPKRKTGTSHGGKVRTGVITVKYRRRRTSKDRSIRMDLAYAIKQVLESHDFVFVDVIMEGDSYLEGGLW